MFEKFNTISKKVEIKKSRSFEELQVLDIICKNQYHTSHITLAKMSIKYDVLTYNKVSNSIFNENINSVILNTKKDEEIAKLVQTNKNITKTFDFIIHNSFIKLKKVFKMSLKHYCFYDIIAKNDIENTVTIAFLPISTSDNIISCGTQKFNKVFVYSNGSIDIYITRLLFHKTMTKQEFYEWENDIKNKYEGDTNVRKLIFNEIQKDLDKNSYSLLKDSDLINPNTELLSKELPLVKFKFTELEL